MEKKQDSNEAGAVLGFLVIVLGLLGWWWWQLGDAGRQGWLWAVGRAGGYGPVPGDMAAQLEWLALNRLEDMQGMVGLLMVTGLAGSIEGTARRQTVVLSGFGLRWYKGGRSLVLLWLVCLVLSLVTPLPLPYLWVAVTLAGLLWLAGFSLARGLRRIQ